LTAIDHFREEKDVSEMERAELEEKLREVQQQHADYVYDTEKKHVIGMDRFCRYLLSYVYASTT